MSEFDYDLAFSRNIGIVTKQEQEKIKNSTIAFAGMGGVGGEYLISLIRMGVEKIKIADLDEFEIQNFNRQFGANVKTIGIAKTQAMKELALETNPNCQIEVFDQGINKENIDTFLTNVDLVIDGVDFFVLDVHEQLIKSSLKKGIPIIAAVPLGHGVGALAFKPNGPSFSNFFSFHLAKTWQEKQLLFALAFGPAGYQSKYIDIESISINEKRGPSYISGIKLSAAIISTISFQFLLHPNEVKAVPYVTHFDLRLMKLFHKKLNWGNRGPLQRLKFWYAKRKYLT